MKFKVIKLIIFITVLGTIVYMVSNKFIKQKNIESKIQTSITQTPTAIDTCSPTPVQISADGLKNVIEIALEGTNSTYGVVIKNLKTGESYYANEHREFEPGSLYKLWIMAAAVNQIQNGQLNEDEVLSEDIGVLNDKFNISSESAELTSGTITLNVKDALEKMITVSHNYAALLLSARIRLSTVINFLQENDFNESILGEPPKTTPYDIALFFEKLYRGELANSKNTQTMIDLLKRQTLNDKLPKYLPQDVSIAHKTGEIDLFTHDAGIVFGEEGDYIIAVLSESDSPPGAAEQIADISKAVYEYFEKE